MYLWYAPERFLFYFNINPAELGVLVQDITNRECMARLNHDRQLVNLKRENLLNLCFQNTLLLSTFSLFQIINALPLHRSQLCSMFIWKVGWYYSSVFWSIRIGTHLLFTFYFWIKFNEMKWFQHVGLHNVLSKFQKLPHALEHFCTPRFGSSCAVTFEKKTSLSIFNW